MQLRMVKKAGLMLCVSLMLAGCQQTLGGSTSSVTCETINYVYLSHKDTQTTIRQVVANNGALESLGCKPVRIM